MDWKSAATSATLPGRAERPPKKAGGLLRALSMNRRTTNYRLCCCYFLTTPGLACASPPEVEGDNPLLFRVQFYLGLREKYQNSDCTPITTRQLESLIRLSQARAKLGLRSTVTQQDAEDVIGLMKESLYEVLQDETGIVDFTRMSGPQPVLGPTRRWRCVSLWQRGLWRPWEEVLCGHCGWRGAHSAPSQGMRGTRGSAMIS